MDSHSELPALHPVTNLRIAHVAALGLLTSIDTHVTMVLATTKDAPAQIADLERVVDNLLADFAETVHTIAVGAFIRSAAQARLDESA